MIDEHARPPHPSLGDAVSAYLRIGLLSFGGPAGQIALMHKTFVDEKRWISEGRFLHALNFCMVLPGPEAMQLATYVGWLLHGPVGGVLAGTLFVLPGLFVMLGLSAIYALYGSLPLVSALFFGFKAAVLAIVIEAVLRVGRRSLKSNALRMVAIIAFLALFVVNLPFPIVIAAAALAGWIGSRTLPASFIAVGHGKAASEKPAVIDEQHPGRKATLSGAFAALVIWGGLWALPFLLVAAVLPWQPYGDLAGFFSKMAVVTFGGAYAVLAYVAQQAVETWHWLKPGEMLDGLALAETTPGPLVLVLVQVGFLAGFRDPGPLSALAGGLAGGLMAAWVTFIPCFLWIFLGAPFIDTLRRNPALSGALAAISAAVTGVILNLSLWLALHVLFAEVGRFERGPVSMASPVWTSLDWKAVVLVGLSAVLMFQARLGVLATLTISGAVGLLIWLSGLN